MTYSLQTEYVPTLDIANKILTETSDIVVAKGKRQIVVDPMFSGLSVDDQIILCLQIIKRDIHKNSGRIAPHAMWSTTDLTGKRYYNRACISLGIYERLSSRTYGWLTDKPFIDLVSDIKENVRNMLNDRSDKFKSTLSQAELPGTRETTTRSTLKGRGLSGSQIEDYMKNKYNPDLSNKFIKNGIDIRGKDKSSYQRLMSAMSYYKKKGKSRDETYEILASKPKRYNRVILDLIFD